MKLFRIFDIKAEAYMPPFNSESTGAALRTFGELANNPEHIIGRHPEDFILFEVGFHEIDTPEITASNPKSLTNALDLVDRS